MRQPALLNCLRDDSCRAGECFMKGPSTSASAEPVPQAKLHKTGFKFAAKHGAPAVARQPKPQWLHDPAAEGALVLNANEHGALPVVVDPYLGRQVQ